MFFWAYLPVTSVMYIDLTDSCCEEQVCTCVCAVCGLVGVSPKRLVRYAEKIFNMNRNGTLTYHLNYLTLYLKLMFPKF
jgi:hypothetical protein